MKWRIYNIFKGLMITCFFYMLIFETPFNIDLLFCNMFNFNRKELIITKIIIFIILFILLRILDKFLQKGYGYYDRKVTNSLKNINLNKILKNIVIVIITIIIIITTFKLGFKYFNDYITSTIGIVIITAIFTCIANIIADMFINYLNSKKEEKIYLYRILYIPVISEYIKNCKGAAIPYTSLNENSRIKFVELLISGYVYIKDDIELKNAIYSFYTTYFSKYDYKDSNYIISDDDMNQKYYNVMDILFNRYNDISKKDIANLK